MDEKANFDRLEKGRQHSSAKDSTVRHDASKHGDRALSIIGDERVTLTEEEVSALTTFIVGGAGH